MPPDSADQALAEVADELYALWPEEFTAARNARAKAAQASGDRDLAAAIKTLARPSVAAGLANQLVRREPSALDPLLELGVALREATAKLDGAQLRTLTREQTKLVTGLIRRAGQLSPSGKPVTGGVAEDLDSTFRAAVADAEAADLLIAGCLTAALQHNGFGLVPTGNLALVPSSKPARSAQSAPSAQSTKPGASAKPATTTTKPSRDELRAQRLGEAESALEDARMVAEDARERQQTAAGAVQDAETALTEAKETLDAAREELERAKFALSGAEGAVRQAKQAQDQADRIARAAQRGLDDAEAQRDKLVD